MYLIYIYIYIYIYTVIHICCFSPKTQTYKSYEEMKIVIFFVEINLL